MKKSTIIKYMELETNIKGIVENKTKEIGATKERRDATQDDAAYDELDTEVEFLQMERADYRAQLDTIHEKLMAARKEDRPTYKEAEVEFAATQPEIKPEEMYQYERQTNYSAAQERLERIYSGPA